MEFRNELIYISGPFSNHDTIKAELAIQENVTRTIQVAEELFQHGFVTYVPHLSYAWHQAYPHSWEDWMDFVTRWLPRCDALFRIPGASVGANLEQMLAYKLCMPTFNNTEDLLRWSDARSI